MTPRASELKALAELVADAIALHEQERRTGEVASYRPEVRDPAMAAAFDAAMERYGCGVRAWRRSSKAEQAKQTKELIAAHRARFGETHHCEYCDAGHRALRAVRAQP